MDQKLDVTVVISFRERWSLTDATVRSVLRRSPVETQILLLDTGIPTEIRQNLPVDERVTIVPLGSDSYPNIARRNVMPLIKTENIIFIDNDVEVAENWLEPLIALLRIDRVGIVAPLYFIGADEESQKIHMAGGEWFIWPEGNQIVLDERHKLMNANLAEVKEGLTTARCAFAEYHALAVRREVASLPDFFHPKINIVHEHIHASLIALRHGYETWFTPDSRVHYKAMSTWNLREQQYFKRRWALIDANESIAAFCDYWGVVDSEHSFGGVRQFLESHNERISFTEPLTAQLGISSFQRANLPQTPGELYDLLLKRGYKNSALKKITTALVEAMRIFSGIYRPCGRPFICHAIGTAGILGYAGANQRLIKAGLLHAAFTHTNTRDLISSDLRGRVGQAAYEITRNYKNHPGLPEVQDESISFLSNPVTDVVLIEAANEIDMIFSEEVAYTGRSDLMDNVRMERVLRVCELSGLTDLAALLRLAFKKSRNASVKLKFANFDGSFFFESGIVTSAVITDSVQKT